MAASGALLPPTGDQAGARAVFPAAGGAARLGVRLVQQEAQPVFHALRTGRGQRACAAVSSGTRATLEWGLLTLSRPFLSSASLAGHGVHPLPPVTAEAMPR